MVPAPLLGPSIQDVLAANQTGTVKAKFPPPCLSRCRAVRARRRYLHCQCQVRKCQCHDPNHPMLIQFIAYIWTF